MTVTLVQQRNPVITVNVKDYGATGNGVTDDTVAINAAFAVITNAGSGTLYFPTGTYLTKDLLFRNASNFTLRGDRGSVIWHSPNTVSSPGQACHDVAIIADCTDFAVDGLSFDARRDTITGDQYLTANAASGQPNITVQNGAKYVVGMGVSLYGGLTANSGTEKTFNDSFVLINAINGNVLTLSVNLSHSYTGTGASGGAYLTQYQTGGQVAYTIAGRNLGNEDSQNGLHLISCQRFVVRNCTFQNTWESPLKLGTGFQTTSTTDGCSNGIIANNISQHGYDQGISVWSGQYITVANNWCKDAGWAGISFTHCNDCTASANVCINNIYTPATDLNEGTGIAAEGAVRCVIQGNVCTGNTSNGIRLGNSPMYRSQATVSSGTISAGATSFTCNSTIFATGTSHSLTDSVNPAAKKENFYVASYNSSTHVVTLSIPLRYSYAANATVDGRFGEDCLITGNVCSQNALSAGIRCDQQINLRIFSNDCSANGFQNNAWLGGTQGTYGIQVENYCDGAVIQANTCRNNAQEGILVDTHCIGVIIAGNDCQGNGVIGSGTHHGIKVLGLIDGSVLNNKCWLNTGDGIAIENGVDNTHHASVSNNNCYYNNSSGIRMDNGGYSVTCIGNIIAYNGDAGLKVLGYRDSLFQGNQIFNQAGQEGLRFDDNGSFFCTDNKVFDNLLFDDQGSHTQAWAVREFGNTARTVLRGNRVYGNTNAAQYSLATTSVIAPDTVIDSNTHDQTVIGAYNAIMPSTDMRNATFNIWLDESGNNLKFQAKYSNGVVKNGSIALT